MEIAQSGHSYIKSAMSALNDHKIWFAIRKLLKESSTAIIITAALTVLNIIKLRMRANRDQVIWFAFKKHLKENCVN